ncbi:MAG: DUF1804 family protein [Magnetococcales bacterium]|nr:DUF1804 family protein [Magnetococcales bacterium]
MAHSAIKKADLQARYIAGATLAEAAEQTGVPLATARTWKSVAKGEEDWDRQRASRRLAGGMRGLEVQEILMQFLTAHSMAVREMQSPDIDPATRVQRLASLSDALAKTMRSLGMADPKATALGTALEVMGDLVTFIGARHPKQAALFAEMLAPFGKILEQKYG